VGVVKKGIIVFKGKAVETPYIMRQEADKIFVNEEPVYPLPVIEEPKKKLLFKSEPEIPEFHVPEDVEQVLTDFHESWSSGLVRDVKNMVKKAAGLERDKDFVRDASGLVRDASDFIQDFQEQKETLEKVLAREDISFVETETYKDVLVPMDEKRTWGAVALFNEAERLRKAASIHKEFPVPAKYPYKDAAKFKQYMETGLKQGDMIIIDENQIEFIPQRLVDAAAKKVPDFEGLTPDEKAEALTDALTPDLSKPRIRRLKSAVIFFPEYSWQKNSFGRHARYPFSLATKLRSRQYRVWIFLDTMVNLEKWALFLESGPKINLRVIYNQGHGGRNAIYMCKPERGIRYYFTDQFVYRHAVLNKTISYIHSCSTLSDDRLATAFLQRGACTYGGWKVPTSAQPGYCDTCDGTFWRPLVTQRSTTGAGCRALNQVVTSFECRGNNNCRLP
jgi:hypothetical protein